MTYFKPTTLLLAVSLAAAPALGAETDDAAKGGAAPSGAEQSGKTSGPEAIGYDLERFRQWSAEQSEKAIRTANEIMAVLRQYAERAEARLETAGAEAKAGWEKTRKAFQDYMDLAETRFEDLKTAAGETWSRTRDALADALENAAAVLKEDADKDAKS